MSGTVYPLYGEGGDRVASDALRCAPPPPWSAVHPVGSPVAAGGRPLHLVPAEPAIEPPDPTDPALARCMAVAGPPVRVGVVDEVELLRRELDFAVELLAEVPDVDERLRALLGRRAAETVTLAGQAANAAEVLGGAPGVREELSAHTAGLGTDALLDGHAAVELLAMVRATAERAPAGRLEARVLAGVTDRLREAELSRDAGGGPGADGAAEGLRFGEDCTVGETEEFIPPEVLRGRLPGPRRPQGPEVAASVPQYAGLDVSLKDVVAAGVEEAAVDPPFFRQVAESATERSLFGPIAVGLVQPGVGGPDRWAEVAADPWADNELTRELRTLVVDGAAAGVESETEPVEGEQLGGALRAVATEGSPLGFDDRRDGEAGEPDTGADTEADTEADGQVDDGAVGEPVTSGDAVPEVDSAADKATDAGKAPRRRRTATRRGKAAPAAAAGDGEEADSLATEEAR